MIHRLRMAYWRLRTKWRLLSVSERALWVATFRQDPALCFARQYAEHPVHSKLCFDTMAGYYNDFVKGGFMTPEMAKRIYEQR